jgi:hypothetical protein
LTEKEKAIAQNRQNEGDSDDEEDEESRKDEVQSRLTQNDSFSVKLERRDCSTNIKTFFV